MPASSRAKPREEVGAVAVADARRSRWSGSYALSMDSLCWTNISTGAGRQVNEMQSRWCESRLRCRQAIGRIWSGVGRREAAVRTQRKAGSWCNGRWVAARRTRGVVRRFVVDARLHDAAAAGCGATWAPPNAVVCLSPRARSWTRASSGRG